MADSNHPDLQWLRATAQTIDQSPTPPPPPRVVVDITRPPAAPEVRSAASTAAPHTQLLPNSGASARSRIVWLGLAAGAGFYIGVAYTNSNLSVRTDALNADRKALNVSQAQLAQQKIEMDRERATLAQDHQKLDRDLASAAVERQKFDKDRQDLAKREAAASLRDRQSQAPGTQQSFNFQKLGFHVASLSDDIRARWGLNASATGVVVIDSDTKSTSYQRGIRPGGVIQQVASTVILNQQQFFDAMEASFQSGSETVWLHVKFGLQDPVWRSIPLR
jgi:hypothetical protein